MSWCDKEDQSEVNFHILFWLIFEYKEFYWPKGKRNEGSI